MNLFMAVALVAVSAGIPQENNQYINPPLAYAYDALEPVISEETMRLHHDKHQQGYVDNLNKMIVGTRYEDMPIEDIIKKSNGVLFNNAAQAWNHVFFFEGLAPDQGQMPSEDLMEEIVEDFGSFEAFKKEMQQEGASRFGSGWVWLVMKRNGDLEVISTANGDNPINHNLIPLLGLDVWEHAYYLDYNNKRSDYLTNIWDVVNWDVVSDRYEQAED